MCSACSSSSSGSLALFGYEAAPALHSTVSKSAMRRRESPQKSAEMSASIAEGDINRACAMARSSRGYGRRGSAAARPGARLHRDPALEGGPRIGSSEGRCAFRTRVRADGGRARGPPGTRQLRHCRPVTLDGQRTYSGIGVRPIGSSAPASRSRDQRDPHDGARPCPVSAPVLQRVSHPCANRGRAEMVGVAPGSGDAAHAGCTASPRAPGWYTFRISLSEVFDETSSEQRATRSDFVSRLSRAVKVGYRSIRSPSWPRSGFDAEVFAKHRPTMDASIASRAASSVLGRPVSRSG